MAPRFIITSAANRDLVVNFRSLDDPLNIAARANQLWLIPTANNGAISRGVTITSVDAPNDPISALRNNTLVASPTSTPWDFIPSGVAGQFRIQENGGGRCWGVPADAVVVNTNIVLSAEGTEGQNQNWVLEFVG